MIGANGEHAKRPHSRKAGPGRYHHAGDGQRTTEQKRAGSFGRGLRNWITRKALEARRG